MIWEKEAEEGEVRGKRKRGRGNVEWMRRKKEGEKISKLRRRGRRKKSGKVFWEEGLGSERERARGGGLVVDWLVGGEEVHHTEYGVGGPRKREWETGCQVVCRRSSDGRLGRSLDRNSEAGLTVAQSSEGSKQQSRGSKRDSRSRLSMEY